MDPEPDSPVELSFANDLVVCARWTPRGASAPLMLHPTERRTERESVHAAQQQAPAARTALNIKSRLNCQHLRIFYIYCMLFFWLSGVAIAAQAGFDHVARYTDDGVKHLKDVIAFYKKRCQIEEEYARHMGSPRVPAMRALTFAAAKLSQTFKALVPENKRFANVGSRDFVDFRLSHAGPAWLETCAQVDVGVLVPEPRGGPERGLSARA